MRQTRDPSRQTSRERTTDYENVGRTQQVHRTGVRLSTTRSVSAMSLRLALAIAYKRGLPDFLKSNCELVCNFYYTLINHHPVSVIDCRKYSFAEIQDAMAEMGYRHCALIGADWKMRNGFTRMEIKKADLAIERGAVTWIPASMPLEELLSKIRPCSDIFIYTEGGISERRNNCIAAVFVDNGGYHVQPMAAENDIYICTNGVLPYGCDVTNWEPMCAEDMRLYSTQHRIWFQKGLVWERGLHNGCDIFRGSEFEPTEAATAP